MRKWRYQKYMKLTLSQRKQDAICNFLGLFSVSKNYLFSENQDAVIIRSTGYFLVDIVCAAAWWERKPPSNH